MKNNSLRLTLMMLFLGATNLVNAGGSFKDAVNSWKAATLINEELLNSKIAEDKWISTFSATESKVLYDCATIADTEFLSDCNVKITSNLDRVLKEAAIMSLVFGKSKTRTRTRHDPFLGDTVSSFKVFPVTTSTAASSLNLQAEGSGFPQNAIEYADVPGGLGAMNLFFLYRGSRHDSATCRYIASSDRLICVDDLALPSEIFVFQRVN